MRKKTMDALAQTVKPIDTLDSMKSISLTLRELRALAVEHGIAGYARMTKAELVVAISF
jgi:Rho termination factor, N-terminal domain